MFHNHPRGQKTNRGPVHHRAPRTKAHSQPKNLLAQITALLGLCLLLAFAASTKANAGNVRVKIDLSSQKMYVTVNGVTRHAWPVSTARRGYHTPIGNFRPTRMHRRYFSKKYHGSPMPHSIFFYGGYAIHGTNAIKRLGRPASHGCIRLHPNNARKLFKLVRNNGPRNTRISIQR